MMVIRSPNLDHTFQTSSNYDPLSLDLITECVQLSSLHILVKKKNSQILKSFCKKLFLPPSPLISKAGFEAQLVFLTTFLICM